MDSNWRVVFDSKEDRQHSRAALTEVNTFVNVSRNTSLVSKYCTLWCFHGIGMIVQRWVLQSNSVNILNYVGFSNSAGTSDSVSISTSTSTSNSFDVSNCTCTSNSVSISYAVSLYNSLGVSTTNIPIKLVFNA